MNPLLVWMTLVAAIVACGSLAAPAPAPAPATLPAVAVGSDLAFIDTSFENASPVWWERDDQGVVRVHLLYDHERDSPNRAAGHFHFRLQGRPGARLTLEFVNLDNVWNGQPGSIARELKAAAISPDGQTWTMVPTQELPGNRIQFTVDLPGPQLYVARIEPYRLSDLDRLLTEIRGHSKVRITPVGKTVEGRPLEILRVGSDQAPFRVFLRARAHPWESGGNWVVEGLVRRLLQNDDEARQYLRHYAVYILPMANKDGVAHGRTRFNALGRDLNRQWDRPADPVLAPENAALEHWLETMIRKGRRPHLALDLHNDGGGRLHIGRPDVPSLDRHLERMRTLESLLRAHTWFSEGSTEATFRNPGSLGEGWLERFGIDAAIHEFNCQWIAKLNEHPSARHWKDYGASMAVVFDRYFAAQKAAE
ncbi:MAG: succinylglutamate desuccinylase/aspartoacylase family protein [Verrucomicrobiales bacterium]|nr:succinylglutamate desuccinylase/aspartoacylase family protein [Verrucomicrobiales bacterium]